MQITNIKRIIGLIVLLAASGLSHASAAFAQAGNVIINPPDLPAACESLQVPSGNKLFFQMYAVGVQVYRWNGASWDFVEPVANLTAKPGSRGKAAIHYAGPTWEGSGGDKVVAKRLTGCSPNQSAIPWLLLQTVSTEGAGNFSKVTYIQRVNTIGGLVPAAPGVSTGAEARVPYATEYYFYRAED